ncbi:MAG: SDR family NAD(P)-dependent oxidoreductase [Nitriliruptorales bacterium]|nr:SDR family NAD(P)-dependent oxidoreductase [Nitriliruptorales bacterium]
MDHFWVRRYGPWAVVAGAGVGLGAEFCRQIAAMGNNLVMVALETDELADLAAELEAEHGISTIALTADLGTRKGLKEVITATADLDVGLLVYNAGLSATAPFLDTPLSRHLAMVDVNVRGPLTLLDAFLPAMVERQRGGVILLSSMSSLTGTPLVSTYAATKAFTRHLAETLWEELAPHGIHVTAVLPPQTDTPGYRASNPRPTKLTANAMPVGPVVAEAIGALGKRPTVIPGGANRVAGALMERVLPRRTAVRFMGRIMRAMYED